jgi:hypothetical protein
VLRAAKFASSRMRAAGRKVLDLPSVLTTAWSPYTRRVVCFAFIFGRNTSTSRGIRRESECAPSNGVQSAGTLPAL